MDERFEKCIKEGKLVKEKVDPDLIKKEINGAESDIRSATNSFSERDFKWTTIQSYYSMFHTAKALVLSKGYREKSHKCLSIAIKALFIDALTLETKHYDHFRDCMNLREDADYGLVYSENSARTALDWAKDFLNSTKIIIKDDISI
ncbi:HEPN domain-containing protein [Candidatus Micrarchaeota archaeon]|nr:HEPN domain-containing protein [Candidatus Micrarchaeota archaeon]